MCEQDKIKYLNETWNSFKLRKPYIPTLSKKPRKNCRGCVQLQKTYTTHGLQGGRKGHLAGGHSFKNKKGSEESECMLGYWIYFTPEMERIPLERCPKPRTKREETVCSDLIDRGLL